MNVIHDISNEDDINLLIAEIIFQKNFEISETEKEAYESREKLKYPQEDDSYHSIVIILNDIN